MTTIVTLLLFFFVVVPLAFYNGVVLADAWNWFIKDTFGLSALTSLQGWGIMLFLGTATIFKEVREAIKAKSVKTDEPLKRMCFLYLTFAFALVIIHGYMWLLHTLFW